MADYVTTLRLSGYAVGALGAMLVFIEFFQMPSYVSYDENFDTYDLSVSANVMTEHTWFGRAGALLVALAFALEFFAVFLA